MLLHSRQKRKVICSWALGLVDWWASAERFEGAGEAMVVGILVGCVGLVGGKVGRNGRVCVWVMMPVDELYL